MWSLETGGFELRGVVSTGDTAEEGTEFILLLGAAVVGQVFVYLFLIPDHDFAF